ncbi:MAG: hypothetical protein AAGE80_18765 [Pseudomonadota bacterium]
MGYLMFFSALTVLFGFGVFLGSILFLPLALLFGFAALKHLDRITSGDRATMVLDSEGFSFAGFGQSESTEWRDVERVSAVSLSGSKGVWVTYRPGYLPEGRKPAVIRNQSNQTATSLPSFFGMSRQSLATVMETYRQAAQRALRGRS